MKTDALVLLLIFQNMSYYFWMITFIKNVSNFQLAKVQPEGVVWLFANFSLALLIKVLLIKKACSSAEEFYESLVSRNPNESEFHQAVKEVPFSIWEFAKAKPQYVKEGVLQCLTEPESSGNVHFNRGFGIEFSSVIGPNKGGLGFIRQLILVS